jgi:superfamily II DNA or RNA helicase
VLELREHQLEVVQKIKEGFEQGHTRQLLYAPTGFGKTEGAMSIMKTVSDDYKKTAMVLDRIVLIDQTSMRLSKYGIEHGCKIVPLHLRIQQLQLRYIGHVTRMSLNRIQNIRGR